MKCLTWEAGYFCNLSSASTLTLISVWMLGLEIKAHCYTLLAMKWTQSSFYPFRLPAHKRKFTILCLNKPKPFCSLALKKQHCATAYSGTVLHSSKSIFYFPSIDLTESKSRPREAALPPDSGEQLFSKRLRSKPQTFSPSLAFLGQDNVIWVRPSPVEAGWKAPWRTSHPTAPIRIPWWAIIYHLLPMMLCLPGQVKIKRE